MNKKFMYITRRSNTASITSIFLQVLDNLSRCYAKNLTPIVELNYQGLLCYDPTYGENVWEYYFEPVSELNVNNLSKKQKRDKKIKSSFFSKPQHLSYFLGIAREHKIYRKRFRNFDPPPFDFKHRNHFKKIIDKYIKIKPYIIEEKEEFYNKYMKNKKIIGVFSRGTNKFNKQTGGTTFKERKKITIDTYLAICEKYMKKIKADYIYLASDSHESVKKFKSEFGDNLIYHRNNMRYKSHFSDIDPPWDDPDFGPMEGKTRGDMGKENIIDTLCLSKCDFLIHTETNIAIAAMLYNPKLKNKLTL